MAGLKRSADEDGSFTIERGQHRTCTMEEYNPECAPEPGAWLKLDEQGRIALVETNHRVARINFRTTRHTLRCTPSWKTR